MSQFKKPTRSPFLDVVRKTFQLFLESKKPGSPPVEELIDKSQATPSNIERRKFLGNIAKAGAFIGLASVADACRKASDVIPGGAVIQNNLRRGLQPRIAIVGGGIAGLNCAYQLKKAGIDSTIYEGSDRAGGRIFTKSNFIGQNIYTECGGEFIDTAHKNMQLLASEFGLPLMDTLVKSEAAYARDTFCIDGRFYTEKEVMDAFAPYAKQIATDVQSLPNYFGFDNYTSDVLKFDQMSISGYFDSIGMPSSSFLRIGLEGAYNTEYGREVNDQTAINFLFLFSINPGNNEYEIFGISDERYKVIGGNQQIPDAIYDNLKSQVLLSKRLVKITVNSSDVYTLYFDRGPSVNADIVVLTIPFTLLRSVDLQSLAFPAWKTSAIQNLGYGTNSKLLLGFNSRVWRNYMHSGYVFTNGTPQNRTTFLQTGWDNSAMQPTTNGGFTVYQGGKQGEDLSLHQTRTFVDQLESMWPGSAATYNGTSKLIHWPSHPYTLASYSCWRVGQVTTISGAEIVPVGNVYFAGEHCSAWNQGFMEGGAETGLAVATSIIKSI